MKSYEYSDSNYPFVPIGRTEAGKSTEESPLRIISWNILSTAYSSYHASNYEDPNLIHASYRGPQISEIITKNAPDLFCLQEADSALIEHFEKIDRNVYTSYFKKRASHRKDGLLIGWNKERITLLEKIELIRFNDHVQRFQNSITKDPRFYFRDNIALFGRFLDVIAT